MEKTMKQLADELGVDKQRVYRYIKKNCINEAHQDKGVKYYDEAAQTLIKQGFIENEVHHGCASEPLHDTVIEVLVKQTEMLQKELEIKNTQIAELQKLLDQQQQLTALAEKKVLEIEQKQESEPEVMEPEAPIKKTWWRFW